MHIKINGTFVGKKPSSNSRLISPEYIYDCPRETIVNTKDIQMVHDVVPDYSETYIVYLISSQQTLKITKGEYERIIGILNKLNLEEAELLNELALEKAINKNNESLLDEQWSRPQVSALLGMEVD